MIGGVLIGSVLVDAFEICIATLKRIVEQGHEFFLSFQSCDSNKYIVIEIDCDVDVGVNNQEERLMLEEVLEAIELEMKNAGIPQKMIDQCLVDALWTELTTEGGKEEAQSECKESAEK